MKVIALFIACLVVVATCIFYLKKSGALDDYKRAIVVTSEDVIPLILGILVGVFVYMIW